VFSRGVIGAKVDSGARAALVNWLRRAVAFEVAILFYVGAGPPLLSSAGPQNIASGRCCWMAFVLIGWAAVTSIQLGPVILSGIVPCGRCHTIGPLRGACADYAAG
jgi:heme O synthase-like polyprenyltransferase